MHVPRPPLHLQVLLRANGQEHGGLHVGLFHVHPALRQVARQQALLPAEVRRLLHVRHGEEEGKAAHLESEPYYDAQRPTLLAQVLV